MASSESGEDPIPTESLCCVRFSVDGVLPPYENLDDYIQKITGDVIGLDDDDEAPIGRIVCKLLQVRTAALYGVSLSEVCDADSEAMELVHATLFDAGDYELSPDLDAGEPWADLLFIERVSIDHKPLSVPAVIARVIDSACQLFCPDGSIVADGSSPFMTLELCHLLGFRKVVGSSLWLREMAARNPYTDEG